MKKDKKNSHSVQSNTARNLDKNKASNCRSNNDCRFDSAKDSTDNCSDAQSNNERE